MFVDEEEGDIDDESDVELDGNDQLDLDSEHNDDLESYLLSDSEDRAGSAEEFQWSPTLPEQVLSLNTNLLVLHSSPPVELFKLFTTDDFVTKMAEQTNFYAVQRGSPRAFKPLSDGIINLFHYTNIHTDSGEDQRQILDVPYVKITLAINCFAHFHAKIQNIKKSKQRKGSL